MQILLNGQATSTNSEKLTLSEFLQEQNIFQTEGTAIAINEKVIPKQNWNNQAIYENDRITIIKAVQGG
jgi:sulfur carrier protein